MDTPVKIYKNMDTPVIYKNMDTPVKILKIWIPP